MRFIKKFYLLVILMNCLFFFSACEDTSEWISLFDGKTLDGWTASENESSWQIEDGAIVTTGSRSHLFYQGDVKGHNFKNFEFKAQVKTMNHSNSGIYFHTSFQEEGWPSKGYECQIVNSVFETDNQYTEHKMTGSLYGIRNLAKPPVKDGEWFNYHIIVQGKTIQIYINENLVVDYTEPEEPMRLEDMKERLLSSGTFALQCHDPSSKVYFKEIKVKPLADDLPSLGKALDDRAYEKKLLLAAKRNIPLTDLHMHLKKGLTIEQALAHARTYGFTYGIAYNCGINMGFESNDSLQKFIDDYKRPPQTYLAMQAEGREWLELFSKETIDQFDYVFTDAMTWTNDNGKRMRLWLKEETEVGDPQNFMDQLVDRIENIIGKEPIDIYVNATFLPEEIQDQYDELWTDQRMDRVISVLKSNHVAMEISARYQIPSARFIRRAKDAGVKFTFGTNNTGSDDLGRLEYCLDMIEQCDLQPEDIWMPDVTRSK
ncbi:family 16 glycoside hydrolase [Lutimonas sp.]|uniref:family 16 glycoside hydrolase n=1 Tax=Lutimonas sp. TaxID=1872403 RepID=UPI003C72319D